MREKSSRESATLALSTKLEEDFVSPLAALRGALEILHDHEDLSSAERDRFFSVALKECERLERSVRELGTTVYAAGRRALDPTPAETPDGADEYGARFRFIEDLETLEVDLSGLEFSNSQLVNNFYDALDRRITATGKRWYLLVNYKDCSIWPEAWVAFAHRAKMVKTNFTFDTLRYTSQDDSPGADGGSSPGSDMYTSRNAALARIEELRSTRARRGEAPRLIG